jgi:hypothetical protein
VANVVWRERGIASEEPFREGAAENIKIIRKAAFAVDLFDPRPFAKQDPRVGQEIRGKLPVPLDRALDLLRGIGRPVAVIRYQEMRQNLEVEPYRPPPSQVVNEPPDRVPA